MLHITNVYSLGTVIKEFINIRSYEHLSAKKLQISEQDVFLQCLILKPVSACVSEAVGLYLSKPHGP